MQSSPSFAPRRWLTRFFGLHGLWPWVVLLLGASASLWVAMDFPEDADTEHPQSSRPVFSAYPPKAYRLAEPGDTLDRIALYFGSSSVALALLGWLWARREGRPAELRPAALAISLGIVWIGAAPWPTFDGWPGWSWRAIADPNASFTTRSILAAMAASLGIVVAASAWRGRTAIAAWAARSGRSDLGLWLAFAVASACRLAEFPAVEPLGYWHRCGFVLGSLAWTAALLRTLPRCSGSLCRWVSVGSFSCVAVFLIAAGLGSLWLHRPLGRLKAVVPGQVYISAMPTYDGLEIAHNRHRFKTILNLFPEGRLGRSPHSDDEQRFAAERGIRYIESPGGAVGSEEFIRETLALAQNPDALPILVHCHACMDRTPAWTAMYRFAVQDWPLLAALRETERHRGERPKALAFFVWNRVLPKLDAERFAADPTSPILREATAGLPDPFDEIMRQELTSGAQAP